MTQTEKLFAIFKELETNRKKFDHRADELYKEMKEEDPNTQWKDVNAEYREKEEKLHHDIEIIGYPWLVNFTIAHPYILDRILHKIPCCFTTKEKADAFVDQVDKSYPPNKLRHIAEVEVVQMSRHNLWTSSYVYDFPNVGSVFDTILAYCEEMKNNK